jgi:hypothetical protein
MKTLRSTLLLGAILGIPALAQQPAPEPSPAAEASPAPKPAVTIHSAETRDVKVFFLNAPWGPQTFAMMERGGDSFYNKRTWPFARLEARRPFTLEGKAVPAGNYALVFHPNPPTNEGMSLEVKRIEVSEFLQEGNVMVRTPEGITIYKEPVRFDTATSTAPALRIELAPETSGVTLRVQYGDRLLIKQLKD